MRATVLLAALLALTSLAGLAEAQRGEGERGPDRDAEPGGGANGRDCTREPPERRDRCMERLCRDHPESPRCRPCQPRGCSEAGEFLAGRSHPVSFELLPDGSGLADYRVGPILAIESLRIRSQDTPEAERHGRVFRLGTDDARLEVHDEPGGLVRFRGRDGASLHLDFPDGATVAASGQGFRIDYPAGPRGLVVAGNVTWDGGNATATGFLSFHLAPPDRPGPARTPEQRRHLGAQVEVRRPGTAEPVQVLAYDDLTVQVRLPEGASRTLRVELDANLTEGRTVALDLDPALLETRDPERVLLRYFDVHADGAETEVVFRRASDLADVLDPTDDGGQPEHWVVADDEGLHVLVSVPQWSVHAVTVQGLGELVQPSVAIGVAAGAAGVAVAAAAMFAPRRRRD